MQTYTILCFGCNCVTFAQFGFGGRNLRFMLFRFFCYAYLDRRRRPAEIRRRRAVRGPGCRPEQRPPLRRRTGWTVDGRSTTAFKGSVCVDVMMLCWALHTRPRLVAPRTLNAISIRVVRWNSAVEMYVLLIARQWMNCTYQRCNPVNLYSLDAVVRAASALRCARVSLATRKTCCVRAWSAFTIMRAARECV